MISEGTAGKFRFRFKDTVGPSGYVSVTPTNSNSFVGSNHCRGKSQSQYEVPNTNNRFIPSQLLSYCYQHGVPVWGPVMPMWGFPVGFMTMCGFPVAGILLKNPPCGFPVQPGVEGGAVGGGVANANGSWTAADVVIMASAKMILYIESKHYTVFLIKDPHSQVFGMCHSCAESKCWTFLYIRLSAAAA